MKNFTTGLRVLFVTILLFSALSCSNPEGDSAALYETAQFEEEQDNLKHAKALYEEIIQSYPGSSLAPKAKKRLKALNEVSH